VKKTVVWLLILSCLLVLITLPRFNRHDTGLQSITTEGTGKLGDSAHYTAITLYFRGEQSADYLIPPFTYRPLIPFLASLLPFSAMTAINLINLAAMIIALVFLYKILAWFDIEFTLRIIGCGLFVVSFPTFYYATIGYIDPVLICLVTVGLYMILTNNWAVLTGVIIAGVFVKETIAILVLTLAAYLWFKRQLFSKQGVVLIVIGVAYAICYQITRKIIPVNPTYAWSPSVGILLFNMLRPRSWLSFGLTYGIPGVLALLIFRYRTTDWFRERFAETATLIAGLVIAVLLFGYSMLSAYADGRFIWMSYPFTVPLAAIVIHEINKTRQASVKKNKGIDGGNIV
jgi:hypothetical protein